MTETADRRCLLQQARRVAPQLEGDTRCGTWQTTEVDERIGSILTAMQGQASSPQLVIMHGR